MRNRNPLLATVIMPVLIGSIAISQVVNQPRFAAFHNVDLLKLIAAGMCFGIALSALAVLLRANRAR